MLDFPVLIHDSAAFVWKHGMNWSYNSHIGSKAAVVANLDSRVILDGQIKVRKKVSTDCGMNSIWMKIGP